VKGLLALPVPLWTLRAAMLLVKVFVLAVPLVVMLVLLQLGVAWLRRWYPSLRRYEGRRWDPLAALGTLGFATAMYAGLSYTFPDLPRRWIGILLVLGAIFVNGLLTAFDMN